MTTTTQAHGGGAQPASIDTSGKVAGGAALRVYGFDSEADALAAGYVCEGGPAMSVALITDAQIAAGEWKAEGDPAALAVYTAPSNMPVEGGFAVPVYPVNGWGSAPAPVAPSFDSAEIGAVNASTLVVTFSANVDASDYSAGVTIKVNGTATSITSAIRQSDDHAKVNYTIPVLWHGSGDAVTWEYASGSGNIVAESDATPLGNVTAQSATNNCEYAALLDLQADTLALADGDPVSTWADQSGNGRDFAQTGTARPTKQTDGNDKAYCLFDGVGNWMLGPNFADNLPSFSVFTVYAELSIELVSDPLISKINNTGNGAGWAVYDQASRLLLQEDGGSVWLFKENLDWPAGGRLSTFEVVSHSQLHIYQNGDNTAETDGGTGPVDNISTAEPVRIGTVGAPNEVSDGYLHCHIYSVMLCASAPSSANRAALEARLAARYEITL